MEEVFIRIEDYDDYYVSSLGRVLSLKNGKEHFLKQMFDKSGYARVELSKNSIRKKFLVHRLVAKAFIPNIDNLLYVNHKDENPKNNRVENLEWCTQKYNVNYGLCLTKRSIKYKIKIGKFDLNDNLIKVYNGLVDAEKDGYKHSAVSEVCHGKRKNYKGFLWKFID